MLLRVYCGLSGLLAILLASIAASDSTVDINYLDIKTANGDHLPDFSYCGYHASDAPLPSGESTIQLQPSKDDQTTSIQNALDKVSSRGGGVVTLFEGTFELSGRLVISNNTVLRGEGMGKTYLKTNNGDEDLVTMGSGVGAVKTGNAIGITHSYVPVGATNITVTITAGLVVGATIYVQRAVTQEWIHELGMDQLVRNGSLQTCIKAGKLVRQPRKIITISGNVITLDVPLTDALNSLYMTPQLFPYTPPSAFTEMGLENLSIVLFPSCSGVVINGTTCSGVALNITSWSTDFFARGLNITGFDSFVLASENTFRHTLQDINMYRDGPTDNAAGYPADITIQGTQILLSDSSSHGSSNAKSFSVVTQSLTPGPNAVVRFSAEQSDMPIMPHQRWAHGSLVDENTSAVALFNRGTAGSGQGWAVTIGVAWNVQGDLTIESPPLGVNWCVGCRGTKQTGTNGTFVAYGQQVTPLSLFDAQLSARKGK